VPLVRDREEILGFERRKALLSVAATVVLAVAAVSLIGHVADFDEVLTALRQADRRWFAVCLAGLVCAYAGYILGYREIARAHGGPRLPLTMVAQIVGIGFGANVVGSAAGGLAVDFWALHRAGLSVHDAARRVLGLNTLEWALLGTLATVASIVVLAGHGEGAPLPMTLAWLVVVPVSIAAAAWVTSAKRVRRFTDRADREQKARRQDQGRLGLAWVKAKKGMADVIGGVEIARHLVTHPRHHPAAVLGFAVYWFGHLLTLWAALRAFTGDTQLVLATLVLAFATGYAATALPLPGGGSGGIEAALVFSLSAVGVPLAPALLGVLVYRFFTFWLPLVPALTLVGGLPRLNRELGTAQP
jgi:glycosyltransferase 2 family protein